MGGDAGGPVGGAVFKGITYGNLANWWCLVVSWKSSGGLETGSGMGSGRRLAGAAAKVVGHDQTPTRPLADLHGFSRTLQYPFQTPYQHACW
jgi:hypothetical protein